MSIVITSACDDDNDDNDDLHETDRTFMVNAAMANKAEIELGAIAASKGQAEGVKMFGSLMVQEHQTALDELNEIADDEDVDLPNTLDQKHQQLKQQLLSLNGYTFDTTYIRSQIMDHEQAIELFENEAAYGRERRIKEYANKYLPHIKNHLHKADSISVAIGL